MEATADIFTFFQSDLQNNSFAAFEEMRKKGQFCDMTIRVQNQSITAHRIVVAAAIPYFRSIFDFSDSHSEEREILVDDDLDPKALESLISFAYTSRVDITPENVQSLLVTAQLLELNQVRDSCCKFVSKRLNIYNVWEVHKFSSGLSNFLLVANCNSYIVKNFEDFSRTHDFLELSPAILKEIVSANDLLISSEEVVFEAIMKWVKFSSSDREKELLELLTAVRMIYLSISYLMEKVDTEELIINSKPCRDLVNKVKYYHLLPRVTAEFVRTEPRNCLMTLYAFCSDYLYSETDSAKVTVFSLVNNDWVALNTTDLLGDVHNVIDVYGKIYIFCSESILIFNPRNQEYEKLKSDNELTDGSAMVFHEEKVYCFGGWYPKMQTKIRVFDTQSNKWNETHEMKTARRYAAAATLGGFIYVTGGFSAETTSSTVEKYCPSRGELTYVQQMLVGRTAHGCTSMNGKIYVCGGIKHPYEILDIAEVYDSIINTWSYIPPMKSVKTIVSLVVRCGRMYAFGRKVIEVYEPENDEWKSCSAPKPLNQLLGAALSISSSSIENDTT